MSGIGLKVQIATRMLQVELQIEITQKLDQQK